MSPFLLGAAGYPLLELFARGRTHYSMSLAGGLSAACFHRIAGQRMPLWYKALLGSAAVTAVEAVCGVVFNRRHHVWDYRREPLNWRGHICLRFSLLWCGLAGLWMCLDKPRRLS